VRLTPIHPDPDIALMRRAATGDDEAMARLYRKHVKAVSALIAQHGRYSVSVDDVVQETFLRAWRDAARFSPQASVRTYLCGIALNVMRESMRLAARRTTTIPPPQRADTTACPCCCDDCPGLADVEAANCRAERHRQIAGWHASLPPKLCQAIELAIVRGIRTDRAAALAGCSIRAFRVRLGRALNRLSEISFAPNRRKRPQ